MDAQFGSRLVFDQRSLDALRRAASRDPGQAAHQTAVQFETLFTQMVLKSMRDATPKADGGGAGQDTFTGMLDAQLAARFADRPNGLADMIEKQLSRQLQNLPAPSPANQALAAPAVAAPAASSPSAPVAATAAAPAEAAPAPRSPAGRAAAFIRRLLPHAQEAERRTGVPASFILGQAALESGWGRGEVKNADGSGSFNLFGIKASPGWTGATTRVATTEYEDGHPVRQHAAFRSYGSYAEAFTDYARLLAGSPRYRAVVQNASTPEAFASGLQRAGYATDPGYAGKLARTIHHAASLQRALAAGELSA